jgi:hypothetical protein
VGWRRPHCVRSSTQGKSEYGLCWPFNCVQVVNVSLPGQAPELMDAKEDTRLLQQELGGKAGGFITVTSRFM